MTVSTQVSRQRYAANGVNTVWPIDMEYVSTDDIKVFIENSSGALTALSSFVYSVVGNSLTYPLNGSPVALGNYIVIERQVAYTQELELPSYGAYSPEALEQQLDLLEMQIQQLRDQVAELVAGGTAVSLTNAVAGPGSSVDGQFVLWNGTSGRLLKTLGYGVSYFALASHTHSYASLTSLPSTVAGLGLTDFDATVKAAMAEAFSDGIQTGISFNYDAGSEAMNVVVSSGETTVLTTANITRTSSTALVSDTELVIPVAAGEIVTFSLEFFCNYLAAAGLKYGVIGPAAPSSVIINATLYDSAGNIPSNFVSSFTTLFNNAPGADRTARVMVRGRVVNGSNAGSIVFQFGQNTSSASSLVIYRPAVLSYRKITP